LQVAALGHHRPADAEAFGQGEAAGREPLVNRERAADGGLSGFELPLARVQLCEGSQRDANRHAVGGNGFGDRERPLEKRLRFGDLPAGGVELAALLEDPRQRETLAQASLGRGLGFLEGLDRRVACALAGEQQRPCQMGIGAHGGCLRRCDLRAGFSHRRGQPMSFSRLIPISPFGMEPGAFGQQPPGQLPVSCGRGFRRQGGPRGRLNVWGSGSVTLERWRVDHGSYRGRELPGSHVDHERLAVAGAEQAHRPTWHFFPDQPKPVDGAGDLAAASAVVSRARE
jgi:hypothetical protein